MFLKQINEAIKVIVSCVLRVFVEKGILDIGNNSFTMIIRQEKKWEKVAEDGSLDCVFFMSEELKDLLEWIHYYPFLHMIENLFSSAKYFVKEVSWNTDQRLKVWVSSLKSVKEHSLVLV